MLYEKQISPPYKPPVKSERDLEHFDPQFTNEPVQLTPDDQYVASNFSFSVFIGRDASAKQSGNRFLSPSLLQIDSSCPNRT